MHKIAGCPFGSGKTVHGEAMAMLRQIPNNEADESLRPAFWLKTNEKKRLSDNMPFGQNC